ncbi:MAG TPA: LysR substrate-binding domain-containing protein [Noviherbaspirillum sp.]|jgi:DNA-binding transcriptional LysR family regulator|uniref:LysR substrate-binding domain-containing protein n=1 Tax=Noviherbaspirillum sp. TaxID=1926288 RepID=UPI002F94CC53
MLKLTLEALQIIDAIDRLGSFSAAGKEIFRVPSTISYTVGKLEEDLGVALFVRSGPKVTLTPAGKELLKEGRHLLRAAGDLESRVRRVASGWETEFAIGMDSLLSPAALGDDIAAFYAAAEYTRLKVAQEALTGPWEALLDRRVDLLVGAAGDGPAGGGYKTAILGSIDFVFAVAPSHPLASVGRRLRREDLHRHRAVAVADSGRRSPARTIGLLWGQDTLTVPDMHTKYLFQLSGLGVGFLPVQCARAALASGALVALEVEEPKPPETFHLAWRTGEEGAALAWWLQRAKRYADPARFATLLPRFDETRRPH